MKKLLLLIAIVFYFNANAQIPNAGFENWTAVGSYVNPTGWDNLNAMEAAMGSTLTCVKGTPGNPGASYIKLVSKTISMMGVMPGIATCGVLNTSSYQAVSGFAFTQRPQSLTGSWQHMVYNTDTGYVAVYLTKWNSAMAMRDTIAMVVQKYSDMIMMWTPFSIDLMYMSGATPDSAIITLAASGYNPVVNSYLYVDNLAFAGSVAGINQFRVRNSEFRIYPNPANSVINVELGVMNETTEVQVLNTLGEVVIHNSSLKTHNLVLDLGNLPNGVYFIKSTQGTAKFIKQ